NLPAIAHTLDHFDKAPILRREGSGVHASTTMAPVTEFASCLVYFFKLQCPCLAKSITYISAPPPRWALLPPAFRGQVIQLVNIRD
ncbi:MAG: hypothetical protein ACPG1A_07650, partial [Halioglobus sp.]